MARGLKKYLATAEVKSINKTIRVSPNELELINQLMKAKGCTFSGLVLDLIRQESIRNKKG